MMKNSDCKGCIYFHSELPGFQFSGVYKCHHTLSGFKILENCPCVNCLIKSVCTEECELLKKCQVDDKNSISYFIKRMEMECL